MACIRLGKRLTVKVDIDLSYSTGKVLVACRGCVCITSEEDLCRLGIGFIVINESACGIRSISESIYAKRLLELTALEEHDRIKGSIGMGGGTEYRSAVGAVDGKNHGADPVHQE